MMLTVKLTKSSAIDPQDTARESVVNPPCWASETAVSLNLTIPSRNPGAVQWYRTARTAQRVLIFGAPT